MKILKYKEYIQAKEYSIVEMGYSMMNVDMDPFRLKLPELLFTRLFIISLNANNVSIKKGRQQRKSIGRLDHSILNYSKNQIHNAFLKLKDSEYSEFIGKYQIM